MWLAHLGAPLHELGARVHQEGRRRWIGGQGFPKGEDRLADRAPAAAATEAPERILQAPSLRFRHCKWKMILFD